MRIGGEGGLLDSASRRRWSCIGTFDLEVHVRRDPDSTIRPSGYRCGHPGGIAGRQCVDPVDAGLPTFVRDRGFANLPTVPVMHLEVTGAVAGAPYTIGPGTPLRAAAGFPGPLVESLLGGAITPLLTPVGGFVAPKFGMSDQDIELTAGSPGINGIAGSFEGPGITTYTSAPHIGSSRYAEAGRTLQLTVTNQTAAHHPFHLHGFSFQPISLTQAGFPSFNCSYSEFRDSIDVPADYTLTFRVRLDDRPLLDGTTLGGSLGRWLFHCHIFFHHHRGMISELVVTDASGREKPNVDVGGSWAYAPSGGTATRHGTFFSLDSRSSASPPPTLRHSGGSITSFGAGASGDWEWEYVSPGGDDGVQYVYITATDALGSRRIRRSSASRSARPTTAPTTAIRTSRRWTASTTTSRRSASSRSCATTRGWRSRFARRRCRRPRRSPIRTAGYHLREHQHGGRRADRQASHRVSTAQAGGRELELFLDGRAGEIDGTRHRPRGRPRRPRYTVGGTTGLPRGLRQLHGADGHAAFLEPATTSGTSTSSVSHTDADQGIMGRIPPQTWLPLLPSGATVGPKPAALHDRYVALYETFADAWRVTDQTSLFVYAPGTSTKTFTDRDWPSENRRRAS